MNDRDLDAEFERIIAGWDTTSSSRDELPAEDDERSPGDSAEPHTQRYAADDLTDDTRAGADEFTDEPVAGPGLDLPIAPTTAHVWRGATPAVDDVDDLLEGASGPSDDVDDHFVPPTEMDLPTAEDDPMFWAIVAGLGGGPLLLLYLLFFDRGASGWWVVTAVTMIVVGFVLLVLRGGTERDPSDDGTRI